MPSQILFLDQFGTFGGGQRVLWEILQSLSPSKYVPVIALNGEGDFREELTAAGHAVEDLALGNYQTGKKPISDFCRFTWKTLSASSRLADLIKRRDIQALYANGPRTFACAAIAGRITRRPVIWHLHKVLLPGAELKWAVYFSRWANHILTCSKAVALPLLEAKPELTARITVIHNPIPQWADSIGSCDRLEPEKVLQQHHDCLNVGILGRVTPFKGQLQFAEAARIILQEFRQVHFWIIGSPVAGDDKDWAYFREVQRFVTHSEINSRFSFVAHQQDVEPYYALLDVVVVASQGPEAFGMTVLEAMSLGKALVVPKAGGISELVDDGETALVIPEAKPETLARKVLELLGDAKKRKWLGERAKKVARERFSRDVFVEKIEQILHSALLLLRST
jgi:glycosyltransferase involved in cell wall biosynthesis